MILTLDIERLRTLDEIRAFTEGNAPVDCRLVDRDAAKYGYRPDAHDRATSTVLEQAKLLSAA